jgi:thiamine-monophosphate kinase
MQTREHQLIAKFLAPLTMAEPGAFGLQNDAASLTPPPGMQLIVTTDSVIAGTHLPAGASAQQLLRKLMRRNLSDLAAMGATPWRYSLNFHLPHNIAPGWWSQAAATLAQEQQKFGLILIGGDCTSGAQSPAHLSMTILGLSDQPSLLRNGAQIGDLVYVSGNIGDAAMFLKTADNEAFAEAYYQPKPRLQLGKSLHNIASSCIDISDGLLQDCAQISGASNRQIILRQKLIPHSAAAQQLLQQNPDLQTAILSGGDDYELLFTAPAAAQQKIAEIAKKLALNITEIGVVQMGSGVVLLDANGANITPTKLGYSH